MDKRSDVRDNGKFEGITEEPPHRSHQAVFLGMAGLPKNRDGILFLILLLQKCMFRMMRLEIWEDATFFQFRFEMRTAGGAGAALEKIAAGGVRR